MFSKDSARQADACRFCWMCRHICPVGTATGSEGWTPRARGLYISMIERGTAYDSEIADAMYHCTLCDACANDCATGYKPTDFIREARSIALVEDLAPKAVTDAIEVLETTGNIFGIRNEEIAGDLPEKADILLVLGQTVAAAVPSYAGHVISLLKKAGVDFAVLKNEPETGAYYSELMGYTGDVQNQSKKFADAVAASGAKKIVVLNPADIAIMTEKYGEWKVLEGIEIVSYTAFLSELIAAGKLTLKKAELAGSVQEPVKLTRVLDEIQPLLDIVAAAGIENKAFYLNGKMSRCVGTVPFEKIDAVTAKAMVKSRCEDAARIGSTTIITASPDDFYLLDKYAYDGIKIVDLFDVLDQIS